MLLTLAIVIIGVAGTLGMAYLEGRQARQLRDADRRQLEDAHGKLGRLGISSEDHSNIILADGVWWLADVNGQLVRKLTPSEHADHLDRLLKGSSSSDSSVRSC